MSSVQQSNYIKMSKSLAVKIIFIRTTYLIQINKILFVNTNYVLLTTLYSKIECSPKPDICKIVIQKVLLM